jgi:hypothetical protein
LSFKGARVFRLFLLSRKKRKPPRSLSHKDDIKVRRVLHLIKAHFCSGSSIGRAKHWRCLGYKFKSYLEQRVFVLVWSLYSKSWLKKKATIYIFQLSQRQTVVRRLPEAAAYGGGCLCCVLSSNKGGGAGYVYKEGGNN